MFPLFVFIVRSSFFFFFFHSVQEKKLTLESVVCRPHRRLKVAESRPKYFARSAGKTREFCFWYHTGGRMARLGKLFLPLASWSFFVFVELTRLHSCVLLFLPHCRRKGACRKEKRKLRREPACDTFTMCMVGRVWKKNPSMNRNSVMDTQVDIRKKRRVVVTIVKFARSCFLFVFSMALEVEVYIW